MDCFLADSVNFKQCMKAHGLGDNLDSEYSDSERSEFDEEYYQKRLPLDSDVEEHTVLIKADQAELGDFDNTDTYNGSIQNDSQKDKAKNTTEIRNRAASEVPEDSEGYWQTINHKRARGCHNKLRFDNSSVVQKPVVPICMNFRKNQTVEIMFKSQDEQLALTDYPSVQLFNENMYNLKITDEKLVADTSNVMLNSEDMAIDQDNNLLLNTSNTPSIHRDRPDLDLSKSNPKDVDPNIDTVVDRKKSDPNNNEQNEKYADTKIVNKNLQKNENISPALVAVDDCNSAIVSQKLSKKQRRRQKKNELKNAKLTLDTGALLTEVQVDYDSKSVGEDTERSSTHINQPLSSEILNDKNSSVVDVTSDLQSVDNEERTTASNQEEKCGKKKRNRNRKRTDATLPSNEDESGIFRALPTFKELLEPKQFVETIKKKGKSLQRDKLVSYPISDESNRYIEDIIDRILPGILETDAGMTKSERKARRKEKSDSTQPSGRSTKEPPLQMSDFIKLNSQVSDIPMSNSKAPNFGMPAGEEMFGGEYLWKRVNHFFTHADPKRTAFALHKGLEKSAGNSQTDQACMPEDSEKLSKCQKRHLQRRNKKKAAAAARCGGEGLNNMTKDIIDFSANMCGQLIAKWMNIATRIEAAFGKITESDKVFPSDMCTHYLAIIDHRIRKYVGMYHVHDHRKDCLHMYTRNLPLIQEAVEAELFGLTSDLATLTAGPRPLLFSFDQDKMSIPMRLSELLRCDALCVGERKLQLRAYTVFREVSGMPASVTRRIMQQSNWPTPLTMHVTDGIPII